MDLKKYQSVRGGLAFDGMRNWDGLLRELAKRNADVEPRNAAVMRSIKEMPESFADLSITATAVVPVLTGVNKTIISSFATLGATLTAGQAVYADSTTTNPAGQLKGTLCGGTAAQQAFVGILLSGGSTGQFCLYASAGQITINSVLGVTTEYFMSATAGKICPLADLVSGNEVIRLIYGVTATVLQITYQDLGVKP